MNVRCGTKLAMVIGREGRVDEVIYYPEQDEGRDSGYTVLLRDAPEQSELRTLPEGGYDLLDERIKLFCLACMIEDYPNAGRGFDLAREHGRAYLEAGEWVPGEKPARPRALRRRRNRSRR